MNQTESGAAMSKVFDIGKKLVFRLRWLVMSQEQRYAFLWARTRRSQSKLEPSFVYVANE